MQDSKTGYKSNITKILFKEPVALATVNTLFAIYRTFPFD